MENNVLGAANLPAIYQKDTHTHIPHTEKGKWKNKIKWETVCEFGFKSKVCMSHLSKGMDAAGRDSLCFKIDQ